MIKVECFPLGELQANCYFVKNTESGISLLIDMGDSSSEVEKRIDEFGAEKLKYVLLTHGHFDHIGNTADIKRKYPDVKIVIGEKDSAFTNNDTLNLSAFFSEKTEHFNADITVNDGDELEFGNEKIKVLSTPGHTRGGVCYIIGDNLFTGDTIMSRTTGRIDFPTGSRGEMIKSVKKIASLDGNFNVYCGHGEQTTLDFERKNNIFMENVNYDNLY